MNINYRRTSSMIDCVWLGRNGERSERCIYLEIAYYTLVLKAEIAPCQMLTESSDWTRWGRSVASTAGLSQVRPTLRSSRWETTSKIPMRGPYFKSTWFISKGADTPWDHSETQHSTNRRVQEHTSRHYGDSTGIIMKGNLSTNAEYLLE